ncbi:MAG: alcohol dehydrogenase catalytic domain-containing protein [Streptosporangiales bacterium]|nr:alcohol dehydrogenase catalytic domain-containing protein [Streptosporangiales bacterium]
MAACTWPEQSSGPARRKEESHARCGVHRCRRQRGRLAGGTRRSAPVGEEVLVAVTYAGINPADRQQRDGNYPPSPGAPRDIPGLEVAGTVTAVGERVLGVQPGDRVMGLVSGGGWRTGWSCTSVVSPGCPKCSTRCTLRPSPRPLSPHTTRSVVRPRSRPARCSWSTARPAVSVLPRYRSPSSPVRPLSG